jgi:amino acid transporter
LAVLFALIACLFTAYSMSQLAGHMSSAGGMYTYVTRGLGSFVGWLMAWAFTLAEPIVPAALFGAFGFFGASFITELTGFSNDWLWLVLAVLCGLLVWFLTYRGIEISTRTGVVLGSIEIAIFLVVSVLLIANSSQPVNANVFIPPDGNVQPAFQGMVFCILAFVGFEAAAPLGEETREPRSTIPRAIMLSCLLIGLFYIFCYYAATVFFGPDKMVDFAKFGNGNPWDGLARQVWGAGWVVVFLAIANSAIANSNAAANATTRTWYAMGRIRLLPSAFARVHPVRRSPYVAVTVQFVFALVVSLWLGKQYGPLTAFALIATIDTAIIITIYILVNLACMLFYARQRRSEFNLVLHGVVPVLGILAFVPAFFTALGIGKSLFKFVSPLPYPISLTGLVVGSWFVLGVIYLVFLYRRHPDRVRETGRVFLEEPTEPAASREAAV